MPPLGAMMTLARLFVMFSRQGYKLALFDISRAHFMGKAVREIYVDLEQEDVAEYGADKCGLLLKMMYGAQDASNVWQGDYTELLGKHGYVAGKSNTSVFWSADRQAPRGEASSGLLGRKAPDVFSHKFAISARR